MILFGKTIHSSLYTSK